MHCRVSRLIAVLLLSLCLVGSCWGEVEDGVKAQLEGDATVEVTADCNAENGECTNPDVVSDIPEAAQAVETETKTETSDVTEPALPEDPHCPSREYVIKCAGIYLDTNQNGKLEREELQSAIDKLPWYSRGTFGVELLVEMNFVSCIALFSEGILKILGSVDKMMTKCKSVDTQSFEYQFSLFVGFANGDFMLLSGDIDGDGAIG